MTTGREEYKVYQSAMVYGQAVFMEVDWETIIKVYRSRLGKRAFTTLNEHANHFLEFLQNNRDFSDPKSQDEFVKLRIRAEFSSILDNIIARIRHEIEEKGAISDTDIRRNIRASVYERHAFLRNHEQVRSIDGETMSQSKVGELRAAYRPFVDRTKKEVFQKLPLESAVSRKLNEIAVYVFTQIKRYGGRLGHRDSRIGEKSWRFRSSSDRGTVRGSDGHN